MYNLSDDLSILTTVPTSSFNKLADKASYLICDYIEESELGNQQVTDIDFGFGILSIKVDGDSAEFRFVPSKELLTSIRKTIINKKSPLENLADETLVKRLLNAYKDFI